MSITSTCLECGGVTSVPPSAAAKGEGKYCSWDCYLAARRNGSKVTSQKDLREFVCECCGESFHRRAFPSRPARRFCSRRCLGAFTLNGIAAKIPRMPKAVGEAFQCKSCQLPTVATALILASGKRLCIDCIRRIKRRQAADPKTAANWRKWRIEHPDLVREYLRRWKSKDPRKAKAHQLLNRAIRTGLIQRQPCEDCGAIKSIQGHHHDYDKPLDVIWVCRACHMKRHRKTA